MQKKIALAVIIALIIVSCAGIYLLHTDDSPQITARTIQSVGPENVKIGYRGHLFYLPAYVAKERGYFAEEGLDAELVEFDSTNQLVEAVINGNLDAGVGGINAVVVLTIEQKTPGLLQVFNQGYFTRGFDALLVSKDSDIKSLDDLEGKTISTLPGTAAKYWMDLMLEHEGLTGRVNLVQTKPSQQLSVLSSGNAEAIFVLEPLMTIGSHKNISKILMDSPITTYFGDDLLFETSVFSTEFAEQNPRVAEKIKRATDKAILFINENPEMAKTYYSDFTPVEDDIERDLPIATYLPSYEMDKDSFQELADQLASADLLAEQVDVYPLFIE